MTDSALLQPVSSHLTASDGYRLHLASWYPPEGRPPRARVAILHGVQSHGGWYHGLGRTLAEAGYEVHFPDRRGSGRNTADRGHTPSVRRLLDDNAELLTQLRDTSQPAPVAVGAISWGGKLAVVAAADHPELVDAVALICPGLQPRVGVSLGERLRIAAAYFTNRRKTFPIPLADPALFTDHQAGQEFIASDPLGLRLATAGLLAASTFLDRRVRRALPRVRQPALLMLAGRDRIVDNERTRADFARIPAADRTILDYPEGHHTLEFELDPTSYARDLAAWLDRVLARPAG
jgi:alpha-beta hydrolase superfamily lysophospholipase